MDTLLSIPYEEYLERTKAKREDEAKLSIESHAKEFLMKNYNMELEIPIQYYSLSTERVGGLIYDDEPLFIQLDRNALHIYMLTGDTRLLKLLEHELVHYALFVKGLPSDDGDEYFENELDRLNVPSSTKVNEEDRGSDLLSYPQACDCFVYYDEDDEPRGASFLKHKVNFKPTECTIEVEDETIEVTKIRDSYHIME